MAITGTFLVVMMAVMDTISSGVEFFRKPVGLSTKQTLPVAPSMRTRRLEHYQPFLVGYTEKPGVYIEHETYAA